MSHVLSYCLKIISINITCKCSIACVRNFWNYIYSLQYEGMTTQQLESIEVIHEVLFCLFFRILHLYLTIIKKFNTGMFSSTFVYNNFLGVAGLKEIFTTCKSFLRYKVYIN